MMDCNSYRCYFRMVTNVVGPKEQGSDIFGKVLTKDIVDSAIHHPKFARLRLDIAKQFLQKVSEAFTPADAQNIIPANHLLHLHKPQQHPTNWVDYFFQKLDKVCAQHNNIIQHPMILMPLICHLAAWKLDRTNFGFADRNRVELQELAPQPEVKKQKVEVVASRITRSHKQEQPEEQWKREEEEAAAAWKRISEEHHRDKEAEDKRRAQQQAKGKAKVHEENIFQDLPEFEVPQQMPEPPAFDTTRLTSLLLASTLMQTMKARTEETQHEDSAFRALQAVA